MGRRDARMRRRMGRTTGMRRTTVFVVVFLGGRHCWQRKCDHRGDGKHAEHSDSSSSVVGKCQEDSRQDYQTAAVK
jgi:hypothetical protein